VEHQPANDRRLVIPESYKIAYAALDAVWKEIRSDSLAILLGGMAVNANDEIPMDPGRLDDWQQITVQAKDASELDLILAYLDLEAGRYRDVPADLRHLIDALRTEGTPERRRVDSVIAT
jgi:hypothetical protein